MKHFIKLFYTLNNFLYIISLFRLLCFKQSLIIWMKNRNSFYSTDWCFKKKFSRNFKVFLKFV